VRWLRLGLLHNICLRPDAHHLGDAIVLASPDLPSRNEAAVYIPPPVFSWTGFYAGLNIGGGWRNNSNSQTRFNTVRAGVNYHFQSVRASSGCRQILIDKGDKAVGIATQGCACHPDWAGRLPCPGQEN